MRTKTIPVSIVALLGFLAASLGCTLTGQPPAIIVTATPNAVATSLVAPVATTAITEVPAIVPSKVPVSPSAPAPTILPTLSASASVVIAQANTLLFNGNYTAAVGIYNSVLGQDKLAVDPKLRSDASFGLGTAALREGQFKDAVTALSDFIQTYSNDSRIAQAYFLRGDAYLGISDWTDAIADFQVYLTQRPGLIDSYAYERIGDAYLALQNPVQALANYGAAVSGAKRGLVPLLALREKVAAAYINGGNLKAAIDQYDAILVDAKEDSYRAGIALTAANLVSQSGDSAAALKRYQDVMNNYPETPQGYQAMVIVLKAGTKVDNLLHGRISYAAKDYNDAIAALYNYTSNTTISEIDPSVYMLLGRAYREVNNIPAANTSFQTIIDQYPTTKFFGDAWMEQGRTLFLGNKIQEAIAKYKELAEKHPDVPQSAESLWRAGYLYSTLNDTESSIATFEILGNKYKGTDWAMDGLFRAGMAAYNQKNTARAERLFALLASTGSGELKAAGFLWLGRLYQIKKDDQLARQSYSEATKADPGGYYSLRAQDLLAGHGPFVTPTKFNWAFNSPQELSLAEQWMRDKFKITQAGPLWALSSTLANDPRLLRGNELWAVAAYDNALGEYNALIDDNQTNPLALYQLASYFYGMNLYYESIQAAAKLIDSAKVSTIEAPRYIGALRFPIGYFDLVQAASQQYKVDPLLVFSVIRQESLFQGVATSSAAAQGLMQIVPDTGAYIAGKINWPNFQNSDLYRPYVNVTFGVYYLEEQVQQFNGNVYAALAAYNAGPAAASEWLGISNGDPDLFLQAISYSETQAYVRRIFEQYETYASIYGVH